MKNNSSIEPARHLTVGSGAEAREIAFRALKGGAPTLVWLGGFRSDMLGTKAERACAFARKRGLGFCRFDYSGHGESSGRFADGTLSRWLEEARSVIEAATEGPLLLVGSSMGAWIALRLTQILRAEGQGRRLAALLLLAPAPDFTSRLMEPKLTDEQRRALQSQGYFEEPSEYSPEPSVYTRALFEDGEKNRVMEGLIETGCPVRIIQGMADPDVPFSHALDLVSHLAGESVVLTLVQDGDHRLSRESDLLRMERTLEDLIAELRGGEGFPPA